MPSHFSRSNGLRLFVASALALSFVYFGAKQIWPALRDGVIRPPGELHSCDLYLEFVTRRPQLASSLSGALRDLPPEKPIAIVMRDADPDSSLLGMLSSYLAWPHTVKVIQAQPGSPPVDPHQYSAIIYCHLPQGRTALPVIALSSNFRVAIAPAP